MSYRDIEKHFKDNTLDKLLEVYSECFHAIEELKSNLKLGVYHTIDEVIDGLNEATANYVSLILPHTVAETEKLNQEGKYSLDLKNEMLRVGDKIVVTMIDREASVHVKDLRRVRNLFEAYLKSAEKIISVLQSILKSLETEKNQIKKGYT